VDALGRLLAAIGQDGPALRRLVTSVRDLTQRLNRDPVALRDTVTGLETVLSATAAQGEPLDRALDDLPALLAQADATLARVPQAAVATLPLLQDLRPVVQALPAVAGELRPILAELRPTLAELRPALSTLADVLVDTPSLLDRGRATVPPLTSVVAGLVPAVDYLRPYTPELAGALANVASGIASYDHNGHFLGVLGTGGSVFWGKSDTKASPFVRQVRHRLPGELANQPAMDTDAAGSGVR